MRMILLLMVAVSMPSFAATTVDGKPNNPYGVMVGMSGGDWSDYASVHFQWAADLVGDWGYVRVGSSINDLNTEGAIRTLAICRAKHLIPVFRGLYVPPEYLDGSGPDAAPSNRDDGYPLAAEHYRKWASALAAQGAIAPYYELGNEVDGKWKPEVYGKYAAAVANALKQAMPKLKVTSAGLLGSGDDYLTEVLKAVPEARHSFDCWGLHPYGVNHPPAYDKDDYCLKAHLWMAAALDKFGITRPQFVMTESGYEIGNQLDRHYPRITDELRAKYLLEAYQTIWVPDPRVVTLTIFMLQGAIYPGWDGWVLIDTNCNKSETYKALAAAPKPKGSDWMPQGRCTISGRITDADSKQGLERVFVYTVPGIYAAETDQNGNYKIENLPAGSYEIRAFRDGFNSPAPARLSVGERAAKHDATLKRIGLITQRMDEGDRVAIGWNATDGNPDDHYKVDKNVRHNGSASQRLTARPDDAPGLWQCTGYATAVPDRAFAAEVWVKGDGVKLGSHKGAVFTLAITDSYGQSVSSAEISLPLEGDFGWTPIDVTVPPCPAGRRLMLTCKLDAEAGTVWFADPYCHYADYPVPSRLGMSVGAGQVSGYVSAEGDERMPDSVVFTRPGNFWTMTRSDGTYTLSGLPTGTYDIWAFRRGRLAAAKRDVRVEVGGKTDLPISISYPPAPSEVQNPGFERRGPGPEYTMGWTRYGEFDGLVASGWHKDLTDHPDGVQAHSGASFAGSIAAWNVKNGGLYQTIAVDPAKIYDVSVHSYTYQTKEGVRGDVANRLGVDPTGGDDPNGPYVIWTPFRPSHMAWTRVELRVAPVAPRMTIFLDARQVEGLGFCLNCFDDVAVTASDSGLSPAELATPKP